MKNTNIAVRNISKNDIYYCWLLFTKPFHGLTESEIRFVEVFLKEYDNLRIKIDDVNIVNDVLFSTKTRSKLMKQLGYGTQRFNNNMSLMRRKKVFSEDKINPKYIPNIELDANNYKLIFQFKLNG